MLKFLNVRINYLFEIDDIRMFELLKNIHFIHNTIKSFLINSALSSHFLEIDDFDSILFLGVLVHAEINFCKCATAYLLLDQVLVYWFFLIFDRWFETSGCVIIREWILKWSVFSNLFIRIILENVSFSSFLLHDYILWRYLWYFGWGNGDTSCFVLKED